MNYKIGCFRCGEMSTYDIQESTNYIKCPYCGKETMAFSLLIDQMVNLESQIKLLKESLEFYAKKSNWGTVTKDDVLEFHAEDYQGTFELDGEPSNCFKGGKRAREALKQIEEMK